MKKLSFLLLALTIGFVSFAQQTYTVKFELTVPEGVPNQGRDIYISGNMPPLTEWQQPGSNPDLKMSLKTGTTNVYTITLFLNAGNIFFKFFQATTANPDWDSGEWPGDPNRTATISQNCLITAFWADQNSTNVTPLTAINEIKNSNFVYPSVATDFININASGEVQIFDLCGKIVFSQNQINNQTINISNLQSGIYLVKLENKEGSKIQKIFKQ